MPRLLCFVIILVGWDAMFKMTGIERGGISYIANRHSKANNKYMKCYHNGKESEYITSLDANNLHGYAMSHYLLCSEFK